MPADLTTLQKVEDRWHQVEAQEQINAQALIGMASRLLRRLVPDIDTRVASGDLDPDLVSDVVISWVLRKLQNPEGIREIAVDDYREVRDTSAGSGLGFTQEELDLLRAANEQGGAFTIRPAGRAPVRWSPWT